MQDQESDDHRGSTDDEIAEPAIPATTITIPRDIRIETVEQGELPELQRAKVNRIIQKSGSATSYDLVCGADNTVTIRYYRPGGNGYQVFEYVVDENGSRISVTQYAFDRDGNLVHVDEKKGDSGGMTMLLS